MIGIVGGMGPYSGLIVAEEVLNQMNVECDQDFLDIALISLSSRIIDRTEYLLNPLGKENPAVGIIESIVRLEAMGARYIGVACNTSHAPPIWSKVISGLKPYHLDIHLISMVQSVIQCVKQLNISNVGILSTSGTYENGVYQKALKEQLNINVIRPSSQLQQQLHEFIYHPKMGLKVTGSKPNTWAQCGLKQVWKYLVQQGAEVCILACTELSISLWDAEHHSKLIDSKVALAKDLVAAHLRDNPL